MFPAPRPVSPFPHRHPICRPLSPMLHLPSSIPSPVPYASSPTPYLVPYPLYRILHPLSRPLSPVPHPPPPFPFPIPHAASPILCSVPYPLCCTPYSLSRPVFPVPHPPSTIRPSLIPYAAPRTPYTVPYPPCRVRYRGNHHRYGRGHRARPFAGQHPGLLDARDGVPVDMPLDQSRGLFSVVLPRQNRRAVYYAASIIIMTWYIFYEVYIYDCHRYSVRHRTMCSACSNNILCPLHIKGKIPLNPMTSKHGTCSHQPDLNTVTKIYQ